MPKHSAAGLDTPSHEPLGARKVLCVADSTSPLIPDAVPSPWLWPTSSLHPPAPPPRPTPPRPLSSSARLLSDMFPPFRSPQPPLTSPVAPCSHPTPPTLTTGRPRPLLPQSGLLSDMMTFCQRTLEAAEGWAGEREVALTEELDSWLRHHRWVPDGAGHRGHGSRGHIEGTADAGQPAITLPCVAWRNAGGPNAVQQ